MTKAEREEPRPLFRDAWADFAKRRRRRPAARSSCSSARWASTCRTCCSNPTAARSWACRVSATTLLTALWASGALVGFALAAKLAGARASTPTAWPRAASSSGIAAFTGRDLRRSAEHPRPVLRGRLPHRLGRRALLRLDADGRDDDAGAGIAGRGLALGAWGAAQATAAGLAIAFGGGIRDGVNHLALSGRLGEALALPATGYSVVYHLEIALLFGTLVALGPLVRLRFLKPRTDTPESGKFGLADFPT